MKNNNMFFESPKSKITAIIFTIFFVGLFFIAFLLIISLYSPAIFGPKLLLKNIPENTKLIFVTSNLKKSLAGGIIKNQWLSDAAEKILGESCGSPAELLLFPNQKNMQGWLLFLKTNRQINFDRLESTVKSLLANYLPAEKEKILPDKTKVTELFADADKFSFRITNQDNIIYHSIEVPEINFSLAYAANAKGIYLADSLDSLYKIIKNNDTSFGRALMQNISPCPLANFWPPKEFSLGLGQQKTFVYNYNLDKPNYGVCGF